MSACVSRLCWHVSPCVSPGGLLCRYLTGGCTKRRQSSEPSESLDWCLVHFAALRKRLRELWQVCQWVEAVVLDGETVGEYLLVVLNDFSACNPALNQNSVLSYFAEDEVVVGVVAPADFDCGIGVLC
jgi:hypothetical protein